MPLEQDAGDQRRLRYIVKDEARRCYAAHLQSVLGQERCAELFEQVLADIQWCQPRGWMGPIPRKTAWLTASGCSCSYGYGGVKVLPQKFPPWMSELMREVMPRCGYLDPSSWPDACNVNWYGDGAMSVGWHADDEELFQGRCQDITIVSLSLGAGRLFESRLAAGGPSSLARVRLEAGDVMTMAGQF
jgi:alkylated DNA repair dioxygenase AlkB